MFFFFVCLFVFVCFLHQTSLVTQMVKHLTTMWETQVKTPGSGRSSGEGNGNPLQYSCLENPMDGGAWQATVHGVAKSQTRLSLLTQALTLCLLFVQHYPGCCAHLSCNFQPEIYSKLIASFLNLKTKAGFRNCPWLPVVDQIISEHLSLAHRMLPIALPT